MTDSRARKNIAVLGDLHGHMTLAYRLLRRWEVEHNEAIDAILQRQVIWVRSRLH